MEIWSGNHLENTFPRLFYQYFISISWLIQWTKKKTACLYFINALWCHSECWACIAPSLGLISIPSDTGPKENRLCVPCRTPNSCLQRWCREWISTSEAAAGSWPFCFSWPVRQWSLHRRGQRRCWRIWAFLTFCATTEQLKGKERKYLKGAKSCRNKLETEHEHVNS